MQTEIPDTAAEDAEPAASPGEIVVAAGFVLLGAAVVLWSRYYRFGTLADAGPGLFPTVFGALMVVTGAGLAAGRLRALLARPDRRAARPDTPESPRALLAVCGSLVTFALLAPRFGAAAAIVAMVVVASLARRRPGFTEVAVLAVTVALAACWLFIDLLGVQLRAFPA